MSRCTFRPSVRRPRLEVLEDRLPPGDALLGGLLAHALTAADLAGGAAIVAGSDPWSGSAVELFADAARFDFESPLRRPLAETAPAGGSLEARADRTPDPLWQGMSSLFGEASAGRRPALVGPVLAAPAVAPADRDGPSFAATVSITAFGSVASPPAGSGAPAADWSILPDARPAAAGSAAPAGVAAAVHARFDLRAPKGGAFPSDRFTVADDSQLTGRRVNLPLPDCTTSVSDCRELSVLNTLDGFNLQPRLSIPFDGPLDVGSISSRAVFLVRLGDTVPGGVPGSAVVGINQVVWAPETTTLHVESDELLDQHTRYALVVTRGVRAEDGTPVEASPAFRRFLAEPAALPELEAYRSALREGLAAAGRLGVPEGEVVTATVFTTQSATAVLEKIRDQIHAATPAPADFRLGPDGARSVFAFDEVTAIKSNQQTGVDPPSFTAVTLDLEPLRVIPGAVGRIAFGKFTAPDYRTVERVLPPIGTRTGTPVVQATREINFNLYLPSGRPPPGGWPVAIFGTGTPSDRHQSLSHGAVLAAHGVATISIDNVGHGFGPLGTLSVSRRGGAPVTFLAGGRGLDLNGDRIITATEGCGVPALYTVIGTRDCQRQTVVDFMQLTRVLETGVDVDGDGTRDLDPSRISYIGRSFGGMNGTIFLAVEPHVRVGELVVPGGSDWQRLHTGSRAGQGNLLATRNPPLLNAPGITSLDGVAVGTPYFHENKPLRDGTSLAVTLTDGTRGVIRSPVVNTVAGAMAIQEYYERREWSQGSGDPQSYAPHLRRAPLAGVPAKAVLVNFARGDQNVPNPNSTALLRAGALADRAVYYRNDLAFAEDAAVPKNPHGYMTLITSTNPLVRAIALGAQEQMAAFFASDGREVIQPEPRRFFETPIRGPLPEDLGYIP